MLACALETSMLLLVAAARSRPVEDMYSDLGQLCPSSASGAGHLLLQLARLRRCANLHTRGTITTVLMASPPNGFRGRVREKVPALVAPQDARHSLPPNDGSMRMGAGAPQASTAERVGGSRPPWLMLS